MLAVPRTRRARGACVAAARPLTPGGVETAHPLPVLLRAPPARTQSAPSRRRREPATRGFRRQRRLPPGSSAAVRGVGPRRVSPALAACAIAGTSVASRRRGGPGLTPREPPDPAPRERTTRTGPSPPMTRLTSCLGDNGTASLPSSPIDMLEGDAGRRVAPRAPRSRPPHVPQRPRRDADKSRGDNLVMQQLPRRLECDFRPFTTGENQSRMPEYSSELASTTPESGPPNTTLERRHSSRTMAVPFRLTSSQSPIPPPTTSIYDTVVKSALFPILHECHPTFPSFSSAC